MKSRFCAECHPAIYAEHERSTHGRAFTDEEVRLATGRFDHGDCIICHTPRPIFETGIGMNPMRRYHDLEEGNTCMTCHWRQGYDYSAFEGGDECMQAFDPRVGEVEACASCHRNHGTPFQWATAPLGKGKDRACIDCHMHAVKRPVAVGEVPRYVSTHSFPGSRDEEQLRRAYRFEAEIQENEVVVSVTNRGAGHNFPTELKQRSVESLVVVKDVDGREVSRSRMVFRDPYKRPYGLHLPVNTQIPSGQTREHRVPIRVADGTVECELHFKLYFPIEDHHPDLARRLEVRKLVFNDLTPSEREVESAPQVDVVTPEAIAVAAASPANLVDFARPPIDTVAVEIPEGDGPADIGSLIELFQFPVPAANREARKRLAEIGAPALPQLIGALGSWDNKTYNQAMTVLQAIGEPAEGPLFEALSSEELYLRVHARELLVRMNARDLDGLEDALRSGLDAPLGVDRASAARALGALGFQNAIPALMEALEDRDPDVVRAAARALARLEHPEAVPAIRAAHDRFVYAETRFDLATAMARLGSHEAVPLLMDGLDHPDDLLREGAFEDFFAVTGLHLGYDPLAPRPERLDAISRLRATWAKEGGDVRLRGWEEVDRGLEGRLWTALKHMGDGGDDAPHREALLDAGQDAVPSLVKALKYPAGFSVKRAQVCELLGRIGSSDAVPALVGALRDPVVSVATWAAWALERIGDPEALRAVQRFERRIHTLAALGAIPPQAGTRDALLAQATRTRAALGEEAALHDLVTLLLSEDAAARRMAIDTLRETFGYDLDYDADGPLEERRRAAAEWATALQ
jgi:HEAT repeat protein